MVSITKILCKGLIKLISFYRSWLSPLLGRHCRFYPSCSCYAEVALQRYGLFHGSKLLLKRLSRCHSWHPGGLDPVPETALDKKEETNLWM